MPEVPSDARAARARERKPTAKTSAAQGSNATSLDAMSGALPTHARGPVAPLRLRSYRPAKLRMSCAGRRRPMRRPPISGIRGSRFDPEAVARARAAEAKAEARRREEGVVPRD
jgi:hypothetical protein